MEPREFKQADERVHAAICHSPPKFDNGRIVANDTANGFIKWYRITTSRDAGYELPARIESSAIRTEVEKGGRREHSLRVAR